jgi:hypothetical protein
MDVAQQTEIVSEAVRQMIDCSEQGMRARLLSVDIDERGKQSVDDVDLDLSAVETIWGRLHHVQQKTPPPQPRSGRPTFLDRNVIGYWLPLDHTAFGKMLRPEALRQTTGMNGCTKTARTKATQCTIRFAQSQTRKWSLREMALTNPKWQTGCCENRRSCTLFSGRISGEN